MKINLESFHDAGIEVYIDEGFLYFMPVHRELHYSEDQDLLDITRDEYLAARRRVYKLDDTLVDHYADLLADLSIRIRVKQVFDKVN